MCKYNAVARVGLASMQQLSGVLLFVALAPAWQGNSHQEEGACVGCTQTTPPANRQRSATGPHVCHPSQAHCMLTDSQVCSLARQEDSMLTHCAPYGVQD